MPSVSRLPGLAATVAALTLAGLAIPGAAQARTMAAAGPGGGSLYNVGQTHSPQLLAALAGPPAASARSLAASVAAATLAAAGIPVAAAPLAAVLDAAPPPPPEPPSAGPAGTVKGIDVAAFQHPKSAQFPQGAPIDWGQVRGAGIQFTAIKATEGNYYANPFYGTDLAGARAAGLAVIGYTFANPRKGHGTAAAQAQYLVGHAGGGGPVPPLMLDIEYNPYPGGECYGLSAGAMVTWIKQFEAKAKALAGRYPLIYTTAGWWAACTGNSPALTFAPLWDAAYLTAQDPPLPAGWTDWALWQFTSSGVVPGIAVNRTDLDALNLLSPGDQQAMTRQAVSVPASQVTAGPDPELAYHVAGLPPGLSLSAQGQISGTPSDSVAGQATTITAGWGKTLGTVTLDWTVTGPVTATAPAARTSAAGAPADFAVPAASGPPGQQVTYTAAGLPAGTAISPAGQVTGWPVGPGSHRVTLRAAAATGDAGLAAFTWTVTAAPGGGPVGVVRAGAPGRCLNDPGAASAPGTRIGTAPCAGGGAQDWIVGPDGSLRISGRCLASGGRGFVTLAACSGAAATQRWYPGTGGRLAAAAHGQCLTGPGAGGTAALRVAPCTRVAGSRGAGQQWTLPAGPVASQIPGGCLEDVGNGRASHAGTQVWPCNGSAAQAWATLPDGTVRINGRCLEVNRTATAGKFPVDIVSCGSAPAERWTVTRAAGAGIGGGLWLRNDATGQCLTDPAAPGATFGAHPAAGTGPCSAADPGAAWQLR